MPGLGASISVWLSYGYAARTVKSEIPFGQGAIAGVIAPEAANNAKEGGAMIPTLFFGIPGSSSMAIMMAALALAGVSVGPRMLGQDIALTYLLGGTVVAANLIAIPLFFLAVPWIVRFSGRAARDDRALRDRDRRDGLADPRAQPDHACRTAVRNGSRAGAQGGELAAGALHPRLRRRRPARGLVVSDRRDLGLVGPDAADDHRARARAGRAGWPICIRRKQQRAAAIDHPDKIGAILPIGIFALAALAEHSWQPAGPHPGVRDLRRGPGPVGDYPAAAQAKPRIDARTTVTQRYGWLVGGFLLANPIIGLTASSSIFLGLMLHALRIRIVPMILAVLSFIGLQLLLLSVVFDIGIERDILGRGLWWLLGR